MKAPAPCLGQGPLDGISVVFDKPLKIFSVQAEDFVVVTSTGERVRPKCVSFFPSVNFDERQTILTQGTYGAPGSSPVSLEIVGSVRSADRSVDYRGQSISIVPFEVGAVLVYARTLPLRRLGGFDQCPKGTEQIVQLAFGSNAGNNFPTEKSYLKRFRVRLADGTTVRPFEFADTTTDNYLELCLRESSPAVGVRVKAETVTDASGQLNSQTLSVPVQREKIRCSDRTARRRPLFGDLHVHSLFSFDSYGLRNPRNGPEDAYRFGRGEAIELPPFDENGQSTRGSVQLSRPLDFMAVTDHSEFLGEVQLCIDPSSDVFDSIGCTNFRNSTDFEGVVEADVSFLGWGVGLTLADPVRPAFCNTPGVNCRAAGVSAWQRLQEITEDANDECVFTALKGYEYSGTTVTGSMNHRNVIFRTADVPAAPISAFEALNWQELAEALVKRCNDNSARDCEALAIPHNPNFSNGILFDPTDGDGNPLTASTAALRARMEPLVEVIQAKSESECRNGFSSYAADVDEACDFEKRGVDVPICAPGEVPCDGLGMPQGCSVCEAECGPDEVGGNCTSPLDYVRNVLKEGLVQLQSVGVNPFQLGFIGSTDTHNATPGYTEEDQFVGHHGFQDDTPNDLLNDSGTNIFAFDETPGGLAVVWAEENTRDAVFDALARKETYATSGTRPIVRFYGGVSPNICGAQDFVEAGDRHGVPMGGRLNDVIDNDQVVLGVHAMQDPRSAGLQQIQIVKVWVDHQNRPQEQVFDITPNPDYSASVNLRTCAPKGPSRTEVCATWTDPNFDPTLPAAYYARVLEAPTCRWSWRLCLEQEVDCRNPVEAAALPGCCGSLPKTIQERAWTSPVYYSP